MKDVCFSNKDDTDLIFSALNMN